jgi:hypothetical protein
MRRLLYIILERLNIFRLWSSNSIVVSHVFAGFNRMLMRANSLCYRTYVSVTRQFRGIGHPKPVSSSCSYQVALTIPARSTQTRVSSQNIDLQLDSKLGCWNVFRPFSTSARRQESSKMTDATIESAKRAAAKQAVADHFDPSASNVGIGSGTTIVYVVEAIKEASKNPAIRYVPTGYQSRQVLIKAGLTPIAFDSLSEDVMLDIAFDGADEVDLELNCIKGGGACLFQEKLVAERARKFVCVAG